MSLLIVWEYAGTGGKVSGQLGNDLTTFPSRHDDLDDSLLKPAPKLWDAEADGYTTTPGSSQPLRDASTEEVVMKKAIGRRGD